jgi:hypothetical protein
LQKVESDWIFRISDIKEDYIIDTVWWDILKQIIYQLSMRIQEAEPISGSHIRDDHIIDKG